MHLRRTLATIAVGALGLTAAFTTAAGAADTTVTVTLTGGSLSVAAPGSGSGTASVAPGSAINVSLTDTTVTDNRGTLAGWTVQGTSTDLTYTDETSTVYTIPASGLVWATGTVAATNGSLTSVAAGAGGSMGATFVVAAALPLFGAGTFTYPATIAGVVPANLKAGAYTGTVTQSIA